MTVADPTTSVALVALQRSASVHAGRIALESATARCTYAELFGQADATARALLTSIGAGDDPVIVFSTRGEDLVHGLLSVLKAGRPFVMVDGRQPVQRARFIVEDSGAAAILAGTGLLDPAQVLATPARPVIALEDFADPAPQATWTTAPPERPFSITYTSGSTGTPKGVIRTWADAADLADPERCPPPGQRVGLLLSATAALLGKIIRPLIGGATLHLFDVRAAGIEGLAGWLLDKRIEAFSTVPTVLRQLTASITADVLFADLAKVELGGEQLYWSDAVALERHLRPDARMVNRWGMSEAGAITSYVVPRPVPRLDGPVPVGYPIPGKSVLVIGPDGRELPDGEVGRLVVRGGNLKRQYWRRPDLSAEVFRDLDEGASEVASRDLGRKGADGCLEIVGRSDAMIKVSGNRVDPAEVEHSLRALPAVEEAVVTGLHPPGAVSPRLQAHVVVADGHTFEPARWRMQLARSLPAHMLPARIQAITALPLLPSGKIDRAALASSGEDTPVHAATSRPQSDLEQRLSRMWESILDVRPIGVHDDFFELGGGSLQAASLFGRIHAELGHDLDLSLLLQAPTVAELAVAIEGDGRADGMPLVVPLTSRGDRPPLFCIHPVYGTVMIFRGLAHRLRDRPVLGVQSPGLSGLPFPADTLEELAALYIARIREVRAEGPYHLLGHSFGGTLVFEMACQLAEAGEQVGLVGVGDIPPPRLNRLGSWLKRERWLSFFRIRRTRLEGGGILLIGRKAAGQVWWRARTVVGGWRARLHLRRTGVVPPELRELWLWRVHRGLRRTQRMRVYPGRLTVLVSGHRRGDLTLGWEPYVRDGVEVVPLEGWHDEVWREPRIDANAAPVGAAIDRAEAARVQR